MVDKRTCAACGREPGNVHPLETVNTQFGRHPLCITCRGTWEIEAPDLIETIRALRNHAADDRDMETAHRHERRLQILLGIPESFTARYVPETWSPDAESAEQVCRCGSKLIEDRTGMPAHLVGDSVCEQTGMDPMNCPAARVEPCACEGDHEGRCDF